MTKINTRRDNTQEVVYKTKNIPELVSGSSTHAVTQVKQQALKMPKQVRQYPYFVTRRGFTLIELLVVVLIIGILAAVALPQYQKAVIKSQIGSVLPLLNTAWTSYQEYYLTNSSFPETIDQLTLQLPWTGHYNPGSASSNPRAISNEDWSLSLYSVWGFSRGVCIIHNSGTYRGAGFCKFKMTDPNPFAAKAKSGDLLCVEQMQTFKQGKPQRENGDYCKKIFRVLDENKVANYELQAWLVDF